MNYSHLRFADDQENVLTLLHPIRTCGGTPIGTKKESCPLTALLVAGYDSGLYNYVGFPERFVDVEEKERARLDIVDPSIMVSHPNHDVADTLMRFYDRFWSLTTGFFDLYESSGGIEVLDWRRLGTVVIDPIDSSSAFANTPIVETPFRTEGRRGSLDVSTVLRGPRGMYDLADSFFRLFGFQTNSFLHGKGLGLHELGQGCGDDINCEMCKTNEMLEAALSQVAPESTHSHKRRYQIHTESTSNGVLHFLAK